MLTLTSGLLSIGTNNLTMGAGATFSGTPSNSNMIIATGSGVVQQMLSGPGSFTFPVGDAVGPNYTPITINFTAGTYSSAYASVNLTKAKQPNNANISNYLNRYWNINTSGITSPSYSVSATYVPADVVGVETNIMAGFYPNASPWQSGSATNVLTHTLTTNSITNAAGSVTGLNTSAPVFSLSPADTVICFPAVSNLTITTTGVTADPTVSYSWSTSSGTLSTLTGVSSILTPGDSGVTTVTVTLTDGNGFTSTATSVITVNATPNVVVTPNSGCAAQVMFATGANTYSWTPNIALSDTTSDTVLANPTNDVVYTVTGTSVSGCVAQATANVGASPGIISGTFVLCQSSTVTMSNSVSGGTWSVSDSTATVDSVLGIVTGVSGGNPVVSYTAGSCYAVFAPMTINPQPTGVSASVFPTFTCTTDSITLIGYATGASTYSWNGPGGSAIASPSSLNTGTANVTTSNAGVYTLTATTNFGCAVTVTSSPVSINPTPAPIAGGATSVCIASSTPAFTDASGGGTWSSASPSIATVAGTGIVTGVLGGSATISYTVAGCPVTTNIAVANFSGTLPWSEGFEGVTTANVLNQCNELLGELPVKAEPNGEWSVGTAAQVEANAGTTPPFGTDPHPAITPHSGSELVGFGFEGASAYFWTPGFTVTAGNTYEFSYYYVTDGHGNNGGSGVPAGDPGDYNAYMYFNTSQTLVGATAFQSYSVAVTPGNTAALSKAPVMLNLNGTTYQQWTGYFTPETSGTYFFCINAQDQNLYATYYWAVDDISFSVASNCLAPAAPTANTCSPSSGSSTSMTVTAASADSFLTIAMLAPSSPSSGPVAGTNYALGASLGGGTVIAKGLPGVSTAIASGFLPGASSFQLYTYAFKHDSCNGVAYSSAAAAVATFTTCPTTPPAAPVIAAMMPGGTNAVTLSGLPTDVGSVVTVYAWTNATGTTPASPASYSVSSLSATYTVPTSLTSGTNLWFTVQESLGGCSVTSAVSAQASIPFPLPWSESFESGSVLNNRSPNFMLGNAPIYISQTPKFYGGEDNQSLISPHGGSWDYLFFGGAISSSTDVPYTSITAYTNQWLVTPGLYCPNAGTYVLSFYYYDYSTAFPALKIQYSTIPGLPSNGSSTMTSGTAVATISSPTLNGWTLYSVPITISSGPQTIFVGLDVTINSTFNYAAIDDIEFCEKPTAIVTNSTSSTPVCTSGSITMTATTTPVASLTSGSWNYTWSGPGTVTSTTNTATGSSLGSLDYYPIYSLTVTNSNDIGNHCTSSAITTTATITPTPAAITGAATLCGGATSLYSGGAIIGSPGWGISGSGSSYATGTVTSGLNVSTTNPASQQTISVNYTNACGSQTKTVTINVQPVAITGGATSICTNNATATPFTDATGGGTWSTNVTTYGTISSGGTFSSSSSVGTEIISYTESTGGCFSTTTIDVGNSGPSGGFGGAPYSVCVGGTVTIGSPTPTGGFWSTSNSAVATVSSSGVVTGVANGVANISRTNRSG